jgi:hypothetical protein
MGDDYSRLIEILEVSVERNGNNYQLTLGHLLNILKMAQRDAEREEADSEAAGTWGDIS